MENLTKGNGLNEDAKQREIIVTLQKNAGGSEVLHFDGAVDSLDIDFAKTDQSGLRKLFCWLLDELLKERAVLKLVKDPSVKNATYQKVAEDYIKDLNEEINSIFVAESEVIKNLTEEINLSIAGSSAGAK